MAENGSRPTQSASPSTSPPRPPGPLFPRVHRPRLAITTPPPPTTIALEPLASTPGAVTRRPIVVQPPSSSSSPSPSSPSSEVSLAAPRPNNDRTVNEYVETPFRTPEPPKIKLVNSFDLVRGIGGRLSGASSASSSLRRTLSDDLSSDPHHQIILLPIVQHHNNKKVVRPTTLSRGSAVVTRQPGAAATFKKDSPSTGSARPSGTVGPSAADCFRDSIICPECGRCRCDSCRQPQPMPSTWLCKDMCYCSTQTTVDYLSCLCCVKGIFYHCTKDYEMDREDDDNCADRPCSCGPHRIFTRWACLSVMTLCMPCLLCYWPLKGCHYLCEKCYNKYSHQGCRCVDRGPVMTGPPTQKRLLHPQHDY